MLDGLLGRGFSSKCKSLIKLTNSRIDVIRRKRNATQKFLKKDMADLLANGLDINAYGRAEGLLAELILSSCYDFIEKCCDLVSKHLSVMQKLRECPEDCREPVSCIMFAAARLSDLHELRDLRDMFHERYGNSLELFVNQQFVENLTSKPSTMANKVKLMQDIAVEFSIRWDSKAFEQRMSKPVGITQDQHKTYPIDVNGNNSKSSNGKFADPRGGKTNEGHRLQNWEEDNFSKRNESILQSRKEFSNEGYRSLNGREVKDNYDLSLLGRQEVSFNERGRSLDAKDIALKTARLSSSSHGRSVDKIDRASKQQDFRDSCVPGIDNGEISLPKKPDLGPSYAGLQLKSHNKGPFVGDNHGGQHSTANSMGKVYEEDPPQLKPYSNNAIPPPYVKPNVKPKGSKDDSLGSSHGGFDGNVASRDPSADKRAYGFKKSDRNQEELDHPRNGKQIFTPAKVNGHDRGQDQLYQDGGIENPIPKPRSVRRRHLKSPSSHDEDGNVEPNGVVRRKSRSRRRDDPRRGLQTLFDDERYQNDEEERIIDKLLIHYSKKPSAYEEGKIRKKSSRSRRAHHMSTDAGEQVVQNINRDGLTEMSEMGSHPVRSISLPHQQTSQSETPKVFARAASFLPDRSNEAKHVHPKLPDYDDLAARFAALKGR